MESKIKTNKSKIKSMLCIGGEDVQDVRILGIWGMGGIGKTTLAQAVYDEVSGQFESCYFLANVRENLEKQSAITLRNELLSELLNEENLHIGTPMIGSSFIKDRLCRKRVLVVLDDVNDSEQLEILTISHDSFGSGSRIIVTSRDKHVLINGSADGIYEVKELSYNDALQLFSLFAFKQNHPVDDFKDLSNSFLKYAKGVPIALKVLGSTLYNRNIAYWQSELNKLKKYPNPKIQNVLNISFDGLDEVEKNIFLDIACFFKGDDRDMVTKILDACYGYTAHCGITNLTDKCLLNVIKLNELGMHDLLQKMGTVQNELGMHDLLQEMGSNVAIAESERPEERSRLWMPSDVRQVLQHGKGTESIQGILLDQSQIGKVQLDPSAFAGMRNLRIIKFYGKGCKWVLLHRGLNSLPNELRYLQWEYCPLKSLPSDFSPENLVELILPNSKVEQLWDGDQNLVNLRVLNLWRCENLTRIPDLSAAINIEKFVIKGCKSLVELPSMVHLKSLSVHVEIVGCDNLKKFPELPQHIKCLDIRDTAIEEISESIGYLNQLVSFDFSYPGPEDGLKKIHGLKFHLVGCLKVLFPEVARNLKCLGLNGDRIEEIPSSIGCLSQLISLNLSGCRIHNLPSTIVQLDALEDINLSHCPNITKFPTVPGNIKRLYLDNTPIEEVSSSISRLKSLFYWSMTGCTKLKSLPTSICELKSLRNLYLGDCSNFECFPEILETMECLGTLDLSQTAIEEMPSSISRLKRLGQLSVIGCTKLKSLPTSICELESLETLGLEGCSNLECFPKILKVMEHLSSLNLSETAIEEVPSSISMLKRLSSWSMRGCTKLKSLPTGICNLFFLEKLDLRFCKNLKLLPELPPCLIYLNAEGCTSLERVLKWEQVQYMKARIFEFEKRCPWNFCYFLFNNCFNLDPDAVNNIVANVQLIIQRMAEKFAVESYKGANPVYKNRGVISCLPGSEILETFKNRSTNSSIAIRLSPTCSDKIFLGFVLCIVVDFEHHHDFKTFKVECKYRLKTKCGDHQNFAHLWMWPERWVEVRRMRFESNHVILLHDGFGSGIIETSRNEHYDEASFKFYVEGTDFKGNKKQIKVQKCGVNVFYADAVRSNDKQVESSTNYRSDGKKARGPNQ